MTVGHYIEEFHGLPVFHFPDTDTEIELPDAAAVAWRLSSPTYCEDDDEQWGARFERFLKTVDVGRVRALVVGGWDEAYENSSADIVTALIAANNRFTTLEAVFLGDMTGEDCEISWIPQPVIRGANDLQDFYSIAA
ncbi:hypothetical protein OG259_07465 [Streptomyces sp. NBC_00250]|uniref:hypothetical protein n=1 Tax=Streptomyces sp. NBC_00250 TaxID=2903641 RepID=UPI002E2D79DB|nr:hypothetical protein [Streptomyces sp. NBC_00250]